MRFIILSVFQFILVLSTVFMAMGQKKPLDHSVYDQWQSIGERQISDDGKWVAFSIDVQEGDGILSVKPTAQGSEYEIKRGYAAMFTSDGNFLVCKIKPPYQQVRSAKIKKVKGEDMPKDSLCILNLHSGAQERIGGVISFKMPEKARHMVAIHLARKSIDSSIVPYPKVDSTKKTDSAKLSVPQIIEQVPDKKQKRKSTSAEKQDEIEDNSISYQMDADGDATNGTSQKEGSDLLLVRPESNWRSVLPNTRSYYWSENGKVLLVESSAIKSKSESRPSVYVWRSAEDRKDTLLKGGNDFRNFTIDKEGRQIAFVAERDSGYKSLQKFFKLWYWQNGELEARVLAEKVTPGMNANWTVNEHFQPYFSKSGKRLFLGTSPVKPIRDTGLVEMDLVRLDVWHYNDDYLQPYQLKNLDQENKRSFLAMIDLSQNRFMQLASDTIPNVMPSKDGDGAQFLGISDFGKRISMQWEGNTRKDLYTINPNTGKSLKIIKDLSGMPQWSPDGKFIIWYDLHAKKYFTYSNGIQREISKKIPFRLYDEEYDMPSEPTPYGLMRWHTNDSSVYIYDRYDIWSLDPEGIRPPVNMTKGQGRKTNTSFRYVSLDPEEKAIPTGKDWVLKSFNEANKHSGWAVLQTCCNAIPQMKQSGAFALGILSKAKNANAYLYSKENDIQSPNLFVSNDLNNESKLSNTNPQQQQYNWMKAELFSWKAYNGKTATGIVYKPENFEEGKKYPVIAYFYETLSDGIYSYLPPAPTPSRLNIPFFVSRGYIVLAPDIRYSNGYPGKAAYDYVVSGARALVKKGWADSTRMGIQGQSWGGYQVAHIITRTNLFAAAWAGAPVANMTSAYGGIRWESGMNRQFQYEKTQSRIGATLWQKPQLYVENSPLFHLPKVKTPLVIMSNDNDGAVPWYQGIEMFTAMRRLNKKVWLLNYNGEAHNLVERKNRKDIQIREQQFFDWLLKGEKPTVWLTDGVPAIEKGRSWGLETKLD